MAIYSPLRSRRFAARQTKANIQLIGFRLRQEWFALPIDAVKKVVPLGNVYGDPQGTGISLTNYQGRELLVVDVGRRIFGDRDNSLAQSPTSNPPEQRFLLIVRGDRDTMVGLPIDSPPSICRVPETAFTPLPEIYLDRGNIHCIASTTIQMPDRPPMFLLDAERLVG